MSSQTQRPHACPHAVQNSNPDSSELCICKLLEAEHEQVRQIRKRARTAQQAGGEEGQPVSQEDDSNAFTGLALSGGGIRSATFSLGVLQGLRELGLLTKIDYLSTVSGGGFIGAWLVAGCKADPNWRKKADDGAEAKEAKAAEQSTESQPKKEDPWLRSIEHLRNNSNYLHPRHGSPYLPMAMIWLRNALLVFTMVISLLIFILTLPYFFLPLAEWLQGQLRIVSIAAVLVTCVPVLAYSLFLRKLTKTESVKAERPGTEDAPAKCAGTEKTQASQARESKHRFWVKCMCLVLLTSCWLATITLGATGPGAVSLPWATGVAGVAALLMSAFSLRHEKHWAQTPCCGVLCLLIACCSCGLVLTAGITLTARAISSHRWLMIFGPLFLTTAIWVADAVLTGLLGKKHLDICREWRSHVAAESFKITLLFTVWMVISLLSPWLLNEAVAATGQAFPFLSLTWVATSVFGIIKGPRHSAVPWRYLAMVAPGALLAATLVAVACAVSSGLARHLDQGRSTLIDCWWDWLVRMPLCAPIAGSIIAFVVFMLTALCSDINELGLNNFYRNRIVNCYMGAVRSNRRVQELIGLGISGPGGKDDFSFHCVTSSQAYRGPFPIINTTVNLSGSNDPAVRSRRAASFFFTPLHYGGTFSALGEEEQQCLSAGSPLTLGRLIAISGAAVSPSMGAHPASKYAFMLTLLNARLGWWIKNPIRRSLVAWLPLHLVAELFRNARPDSPFLYLSDGGHFENLGAYELLRRGCRVIIVSDAEQDPEMSVKSLGALIRMAEVDLGAEIEGDMTQLRKRPDSNYSGGHWAAFTINYKRIQTPHVIRKQASFGYLIYLKSSLTGDEPSDILAYARESPTFPHEGTLDQFFDEAQFESYRKLGHHIAKNAFEEHKNKTLHRIAEDMSWLSSWHMEPSSTDLNERLSELLGDLQSKRELEFLISQIQPGWPGAKGNTPQPGTSAFSEAFLFCQRLLIFMEDTYVRLDMGQHAGRPAEIAWKHLFQGWARSEMVQITWALTFHYYGFFFNEFCSKLGMPALAFRLHYHDPRYLYYLSVRLPGSGSLVHAGRAVAHRGTLIEFEIEPWLSLTCVGPEFRRLLRKEGVIRVSEQVVLKGLEASLTKEQFIAWWSFPS